MISAEEDFTPSGSGVLPVASCADGKGMTGAAAIVATRILGLDPGLRVTGFGLIDQLGSRLRYVGSGCIRSGDGSLPQRLKTLIEGVQEVVRTYQPDVAAVEKVFVNVNPASTLLLGQARGAVICGVVLNALEVHEYTALQVKQAVVGYGKADKSQVQHMVQRLLSLSGMPGPDAADALACAICHANGTRMSLEKFGTRRRSGRLLEMR